MAGYKSCRDRRSAERSRPTKLNAVLFMRAPCKIYVVPPRNGRFEGIFSPQSYRFVAMDLIAANQASLVVPAAPPHYRNPRQETVPLGF